MEVGRYEHTLRRAGLAGILDISTRCRNYITAVPSTPRHCWTDRPSPRRVVHLIRIIRVFLKIYSFTIVKKISTIKVETVAAKGPAEDMAHWEELTLVRGMVCSLQKITLLRRTDAAGHRPPGVVVRVERPRVLASSQPRGSGGYTQGILTAATTRSSPVVPPPNTNTSAEA